MLTGTFQRRLAIEVEDGSGNGTSFYPQTSNSVTDIFASTLDRSTAAIDWTQDLYIFATGRLYIPSDTLRCDFLKVSN